MAQTFRQGFSAAFYVSRATYWGETFFLREVIVSMNFFWLWAKYLRPFVKKVSEVLSKKNYVSRRTIWFGYFFRCIICSYLYSEFEQKVFDFPRKVFVTVVATAVDASRRTFEEKFGFWQFMCLPSFLWTLSQMNTKLCQKFSGKDCVNCFLNV